MSFLQYVEYISLERFDMKDNRESEVDKIIDEFESLGFETTNDCLADEYEIVWDQELVEKFPKEVAELQKRLSKSSYRLLLHFKQE